MKVFMPFLRTRNTEKPKLKKLFKNCNAELDARSRIGRSAGKTHTLGLIRMITYCKLCTLSLRYYVN